MQSPPLHAGFGYAKAFIFGEYAVLENAPALVLALNIKASAFITESTPTFSSAFQRDLAKHLAPAPFNINFDTTPFYDSDQKKWGIGASAACTIAALGALQSFQYTPPEPFLQGHTLSNTLKQGIALHRRLQGGLGSGADVIAAAIGGLLCIEQAMGEAVVTRITPKFPPMALLSAKKPAETRKFIDNTEHFANDLRYHELCKELGKIAALAAISLQLGTHAQTLALAQRVDPLLSELGQVLQKNIVTQKHLNLSKMAQNHGIVAKVSGAGGGDLSLLFGQTQSQVNDFVQNVAIPLGFTPLPTTPAPQRLQF